MSLHPHQHRALVAELAGPQWDGVAADAAFVVIATPDEPTASDHLKRLGRTRFLTAAELAAIPEKRRPAGVIIVTDEERDSFLSDEWRVRIKHSQFEANRLDRPELALAVPNNMPGFPNKLRREWFDAAWTEARG